MRSIALSLMFVVAPAGAFAQDDASAGAEGQVEVDGVLVDKAHAADAKRGVFHFGDALVTKAEYQQLRDGKVRHPVTGRLIPASDLDKAKARSFPIGTEDRWVDEREADGYHSDISRPWVVNTGGYVLISTLPIAKIEEIREYVDKAASKLRPVLGFADPRPIDRPTILVAATQDQFVQYGNQLGDEASAFGAFLAREGALRRVPLQGEVRPAVCHWDDGWGPYLLPHAYGLAYVHGLCAVSNTEVPQWLLHGLAGYGSRFVTPETGAWFAQGLVRAGGLKDLKSWFDDFKVEPSMSPDDLSVNMTQAAFLVSYCVGGADAEATAAIQETTAAFQEMKASSIAKAVRKLQKVLEQHQDGIAEQLQRLVQ